MTFLLDGNVLVALRLEGHEHHAVAWRWFDRKVRRFATCAITQGTLLRVHMLLAADRSAAAAWIALEEIRAHPKHVYWDDGFGYETVSHRAIAGPRQVTDAWLAQLARARRAKLATLDGPLVNAHADVAVLVSV